MHHSHQFNTYFCQYKKEEENWRKALLVTVCCYLAVSSTQTLGTSTNSDSASVQLSDSCHQSAAV